MMGPAISLFTETRKVCLGKDRRISSTGKVWIYETGPEAEGELELG